jgi:hypothetical protein
MNRMFIDPATGEMHDERWFRMQDIDLDTVIEAIEVDDDGNLGFVIIPENITRMKVRDEMVISLISQFTGAILERMNETDDEDEREQLREIGKRICTVMMFNLAELEKEKNHADFHQSGGKFHWNRSDFH